MLYLKYVRIKYHCSYNYAYYFHDSCRPTAVSAHRALSGDLDETSGGTGGICVFIINQPIVNINATWHPVVEGVDPKCPYFPPKMFEFAKIHVSWSRDAATRSCGAQDGDFRLVHHLSLLQPENEQVIYAVPLKFFLQNFLRFMFLSYIVFLCNNMSSNRIRFNWTIAIRSHAKLLRLNYDN